MKRTQSFSFYALLIALLVHLIIILLIMMMNQLRPVVPPKTTPPEPKEERFKLSLKEMPNNRPEAIIKNDIPKIVPTLPIPRGEQLIKNTQPVPKPQAIQPTPPAPPLTKPIPPSSEPIVEPKKAFERHIAKPVATIERQPQVKKEQGLYDILSKPDTTEKTSSTLNVKVNSDIKKLYGDKFGELSEGEQKYIIDNFEKMRRITQSVLTRYARSRIPDNFHANDINIVEFYLYPDRHISDVRFIKNSQSYLLDDTIKETIEIAHKDYPRPEQKTYIRYQVFYNLTGD